MKRLRLLLALLPALFAGSLLLSSARAEGCKPSAQVRQSQEEFAADRFGVFLHWGIYSMFGQGEWYLNYGPTAAEYAKAAAGFYPANFDADAWVQAIKAAGARYICFTTRHHDGFSMWHTAASPYNIVDATPFKRDILAELADACHRHGVKLHLYYSHLDWTRPDYPWGRTGHTTGRDSTQANWDSYFSFMKTQLRELLTNYGDVRAVWFDGWWDHDEDSVPFNWHLDEQYALIHSLQPSCLVGNNHHQNPFEGEDIQIFERDVPGENSAGYSEQDISRLPLETCNTMIGMWGYKVCDQNYKSPRTLIRYLVKTASQGANLLLNIGPQPDGSLPAAALERLSAMGEWLKVYGPTIYGTTAYTSAPSTEDVAYTLKGDTLYVHIFNLSSPTLELPIPQKVKSAETFASGSKLKFKQKGGVVTLWLGEPTDCDDYVVQLKLSK